MKLFAVGLSCKTAAVNVREQFAVSASARPDRARVLIDRHRSAGLTSIAKDFYSGGRHEMLHETNSPRRHHKPARLDVRRSGQGALKNLTFF